MKVHVPPIKTQGIKTKLVPWILEYVPDDFDRWVEPFMGSGVVGFNVCPKKALFSDINPYIIQFYDSINTGEITSERVKRYLEEEGKNLRELGEEYYYIVRDRFNRDHNPLDFLFLTRTSYNGLIRFNKRGEFNSPFNKIVNRFRKGYITKVVNQVKYVEDCMKKNDWVFVSKDFREIFNNVDENDFVYTDPPYIGRHTTYFTIWTEEDEYDLFNLLVNFNGRFIHSTWYKSSSRVNPYVEKLWSTFNIVTREHTYIIGPREENRPKVIEVLVMNF